MHVVLVFDRGILMYHGKECDVDDELDNEAVAFFCCPSPFNMIDASETVP
jgi:hypothetical protein